MTPSDEQVFLRLLSWRLLVEVLLWFLDEFRTRPDQHQREHQR